MKKSKIITTIGVLVIATVLICTTGKRIPYEKQKHFNSIEEIIETLNSGPLAAEDKDTGEILYSDVLNECFSKRKRIVDPDFDYSKLDIKVDETVSEDSVRQNIDFYKVLQNNIKGHKISDKIVYAFVKGNYTSVYNSSESFPISMSLIFIDEGEGWVIDYISAQR